MAEIKVDGRMKVKTLRAAFKENFGATLRVYNTSNHFVDDEALLCNVRQDDDVKVQEFTIDPKWTVDEFEKKFMDVYAIKVQVATADDSKLADNNLALEVVGK
ncbi:MAG: hypothetical protein MJ211_12175 [Bacteroidales bacterium]|nr:hypothetical protein [Bacteroidales bacterium]